MESQPQNPEFRNNPENFHPCLLSLNPLCITNPITGNLANGEDSDEMPHNAVFHKGLCCLLIPLFHTGPESHKSPQIDKYLDLGLNRTQFVKILTDWHSP